MDINQQKIFICLMIYDSSQKLEIWNCQKKSMLERLNLDEFLRSLKPVCYPNFIVHNRKSWQIRCSEQFSLNISVKLIKKFLQLTLMQQASMIFLFFDIFRRQYILFSSTMLLLLSPNCYPFLLKYCWHCDLSFMSWGE